MNPTKNTADNALIDHYTNFVKLGRTVQIEAFLVARKILAYIEVGEFFETT